ncbi:GNAT family N-acetyltransferase [Thalassospira sp.]|uniref:GNAT family N-acetyltransferase n=1 Tax=Thalassospira sp. TaxID=1912094 RepID=UPI002735B531|nr:GNAT family N-acetyltransferase [Thalassospira sp.]MDP2696781.1 GNAT family N-acetyltransferase [Thalassospira sp.]
MPVTPTPTIRPANRNDATDIHRMLVAIARATGHDSKITSTADDIARDGFGPRPAFQALIGEQDGRAVALCLYFASYSTFRGKPGIYVQDLYVDPDLRGSGFAQRLLARAVARAHADGCAYLRLSVDARNAAGQKFYVKTGMRAADEERIFVLDGNAFMALARTG